MKVAVVGATGLVGTKMLQVLAERNFPVTELIPVASPILQFWRLIGFAEAFFNSIHSFEGKLICSVGSAIISSITTS